MEIINTIVVTVNIDEIGWYGEYGEQIKTEQGYQYYVCLTFKPAYYLI